MTSGMRLWPAARSRVTASATSDNAVGPFVPFHSVPDDVVRQRRLLLISYHFPPAQSAGALRWQKMTRFAADRGWGIDVITLRANELSSLDPERLTGIPPGTRVFGVPNPPLNIAKIGTATWRILYPLHDGR